MSNPNEESIWDLYVHLIPFITLKRQHMLLMQQKRQAELTLFWAKYQQAWFQPNVQEIKYVYCSPHCLSSLGWRRSKKTSKLRVTGFCAGNSEFPAQMASNAKMFLFDDVIMFDIVIQIFAILLKAWIWGDCDIYVTAVFWITHWSWW